MGNIYWKTLIFLFKKACVKRYNMFKIISVSLLDISGMQPGDIWHSLKTGLCLVRHVL